MTLPPEIIAPRRKGSKLEGSKLGNVIRRLASNQDGEVVATVDAMKRVLESVGADLHVLAEHLEKPNGSEFDEAEATKIYRAGFAAGVQRTENAQHGLDDFRDADGKPDWRAVALFCQRNKHRLYSGCHEFLDSVASRVPYNREPTPKMHQWLHSLFLKLGGEIK